MSDYYAIETNIPIPKSTKKFPLAQMELGDSFLCPLKLQIQARGAITKFQRTNKAIKFTTRKISDTELRIWRIV